jgi:AraC-like DNA-binding protein
MDRGSFIIRACALHGVQAVEAHSRHAFPRHTHDAYGIGVIVAGAQRSWSGRGMVEAGPGNIITCNPGEVHDGMPLGGARKWKMLYLSAGVVAPIVADIREGASMAFEFASPVIANPVQLWTFNVAYDALMDRDLLRAHERLILVLADLIQAKKSDAIVAPCSLLRVKARIDDGPAAPFTLAALAREADLSRFQLVRRFRKLTGLTLHAYIVQRRLEAARQLIAKGTSLASVAVTCGFSDQSHLNRTFVSRYGMTPGAYAKAMR